MKKVYFLLLLSILLASCAGNKTVKPNPKPAPPTASKPAPTTSAPSAPSTSPPAQAPSATTPPTATGDAAIGDNSKKPGGYYLDDGPDANPPQNLDEIPNASPKKEPLLARSNKPYKALGVLYTPMTTAQDYKVRGIASWYGKRFHGKKTSSGEIYNMYAMSAAHTTLPLPSYAKVTNPANGRSVIVRINDRGPFKSTRIIDLSYAAAYKLRLVNQGSGVVDVEAIHPDKIASDSTTTSTAPITSNTVVSPPVVASVEPPVLTPVASNLPATEVSPSVETQTTENKAVSTPQNKPPAANNNAVAGIFVQAGAFKEEANAEALKKKIQELPVVQNTKIYRVYNGDLHRLILGPFESRQAAEQAATNIHQQLNITTIITNQ